MALHPQAKHRLVELISADLKNVVVKNGMFPEPLSFFFAFYKANEALPNTGAQAEKWQDQIGHYPFIDFAQAVITRELNDKDSYQPGDVSNSLVDFEEYKDAAAAAERLVDLFSSLPWSYRLTVKLPRGVTPPLPGDVSRFPLGPTARLLEADLLLSDEMPLQHGNRRVLQRAAGTGLGGLLTIGQQQEWEEGSQYLQFDTDGLIGIYGSGGAVDEVSRVLQSFLGLGLAMGLFQYEADFKTASNKHRWIVHQKVEGSWQLDTGFDLNESDAAVLNGIKMWDSFGANYPDHHKLPWLQGVLSTISKVFNSSKATSILLASKWFFDSFKRSDDVLTYVRRVTVLEIILGSDANTSKASLGELMGNRLAYLIGKTHEDRAIVLQDFKDVYGLRSKILHTGKFRLRHNERFALAKLKNYCERALKEEVRLLVESA